MRCYTLKKTVCELFAGVGGFRCGLNHIKTLEDIKKEEKWETVWFSQWEPAEKKTQYAHDCYVYHFASDMQCKFSQTQIIISYKGSTNFRIHLRVRNG